MRGEMLERLMDVPDLPHLIQELMQTEYGPDLEESLIGGRTAEMIDVALRKNVVRTYRKVLGFSNREAVRVISTLLGRWDVFNLKTIVRGKQAELSTEEITAGLFPVGELTETDLEGLLLQNDIREVVQTAVTWELPQAPALREGYSAFAKSGLLADMELALDQYYAAWATRRLSRRGEANLIGRKVMHMQIDMMNLVMVFRAARESLAEEQASAYFLPGGRMIERELYLHLAALADVDEILDGLAGTMYHKVCEEASIRYLEKGSLAVFERALEDDFTRKVVAMGTRDPLGIGIPIAYLWGKQNEVTNIRIIVKGTEVGIPASSMRREFILV